METSNLHNSIYDRINLTNWLYWTQFSSLLLTISQDTGWAYPRQKWPLPWWSQRDVSERRCEPRPDRWGTCQTLAEGPAQWCPCRLSAPARESKTPASDELSTGPHTSQHMGTSLFLFPTYYIFMWVWLSGVVVRVLDLRICNWRLWVRSQPLYCLVRSCSRTMPLSLSNVIWYQHQLGSKQAHHETHWKHNQINNLLYIQTAKNT